ncbi:Oxidoreductase FAD-binding domain protein [Beutenbergia cavernae DSM 12333]|uniref:Oxidoreductase FAD-binding domain protein n=1 Tax=Beutenbergia cavernae (strain ATCC BAA-8 / DSM 12333 / CCUG 43141 / JCM 11478 / NBRC 16432 / NCIMB 13614 / HKI 0122) TaxID=471853 RepID=C5C5X5_BEUC1|nr:ferredoxin reductase [Beutenbergia cavernae]ACQ82333.1 Oxidoreductase FAD-binding domain protein [Beutenbergia cavernae DSM 12333]
MTSDVGSAARLGDRFGVRPGWQVARLVETRPESVSARTLVLAVPRWPGHLAGQHVDLRLTAADGYTAERSYSLAGPPEAVDDDGVPTARIELAVQRVPGGEVSTYLADDFAPGQLIEVRGPIGGWFVWSPGDDGGAPVLLAAGGSGIVPLMAMVRQRRRAGDRTPFRLVYSVRRPEDRLYVSELTRPPAADGGVESTVLYTRSAPLDARREPGRLTASDLAAWGWPAALEPRCFVCGPTGFVEAATRLLLGLGHDPARIRTERFGPSAD